MILSVTQESTTLRKDTSPKKVPKGITNLLKITDIPEVSIVDNTIHVSNRNEGFLADFPIEIEGKRYTIRLIGEKYLLQSTQRVGDRENPLISGGALSLNRISFLDIPKDAIWQLLNNEDKPLRTNIEFWSYFRNRIPSHHPLSTFNQNPPLT